MTEKSSQNNINSTTYPLPATAAEIGQLIGELSSNDPRAIIIDYFQAVVVFHPRAVGGKPELTEQSIPYLLANYHIEMIEGEVDILQLHEYKMPKHDCVIALNPSHKNQFKGNALWTSILTPNLALIIQQKTDQYDWKIFGLQIQLT